MRLSKKSEYAIRALIQFELSPKKDNVQLSEISEAANIPVKFLEQILLALKNAGFLKSRRGIGGGYSLNRPADKIILGQVIRTMDGPLAPIPCVSQTAYERCSCPDEELCGLRMVMQQVRDEMCRILDQTNLAEVVTRIQKKSSHKQNIVHFEI